VKHPWEFDETRFGFAGRRVLVTGAAGVLGYELCRQLVTEHAPALLRLFDQNESGLFHADQALRTVDPACGPRLRLLLGDVRERDRLVRAFEQIDVVIHTATLQNAALCEYNPFEAVQTNLIGVQNVVGAAIEAGVKRVVLVSQGAAVDPVGVLGASHLMAERLVTAAHQASGRAGTVFASVRVGELAYPDAAWVATAVEQFRAGVPVPLPDPESRRFLLPLGDAARLVLTATQTALGGEVFVCRMPALRMRDLLSLLSRAHHGTVVERDPTAPGAFVAHSAPAAFDLEPEALLSESEVPHTLETPDFLVVLPTDRPDPPDAPLATHPHRVDAQTPLTLGGLESFLRTASALP
jgi:FlaA1/EpsC-like NDP-sugar epimerase